MFPKFWARSEINCSKKWDTSSSYEVCTVNGVVGKLHSYSDWISLKTHHMSPPSILECCPSFGLDLKSIDQRSWSLQVRKKLVP